MCMINNLKRSVMGTSAWLNLVEDEAELWALDFKTGVIYLSSVGQTVSFTLPKLQRVTARLPLLPSPADIPSSASASLHLSDSWEPQAPKWHKHGQGKLDPLFQRFPPKAKRSSFEAAGARRWPCHLGVRHSLFDLVLGVMFDQIREAAAVGLC